MTANNDRLTTNIIAKSDDFKDLECEWDELLKKSTLDNPFLSHQWLQSWWSVYGCGELFIVTVRDTMGALHGILPLYKPKRINNLGIKTLKLMGSTNVSSDFLGCIARCGYEIGVYSICISMLLQKKSEWDVLLLQDVDASSSFLLHLPSINLKYFRCIYPEKVCPALPLPSTWDEQLSRLSKRKRQNISYYRRSLERIGHTELEIITDLSELPQAIEDMVKLRKDRLEQKGLKNSRVTEQYIQFHHQLMPEFLAAGRLRLYFLKVNNRRIAYLYLYHGGDALYFYQTGFDRGWERYSVGSVLLGLVIEQAIQSNYNFFEFLRGCEQYKYEWGRVQEKKLIDVVIYSGSIKSSCWRYYQVCRKVVDLGKVRNLIRKFMDSKGRKSTILSSKEAKMSEIRENSNFILR